MALVTNRLERVSPGSRLVGPVGPLVVSEGRAFEATGEGRFIVRFEGVDDHSAAAALRGAVLRAAPLTDASALWAHELIGSLVSDVAGSALGRVSAVEANPASDLLVLEGGALIPLRFVASSAPGRVVVDIPAGLLDL